MTSLCFSLTHAFSKTFSAGDEVVITELDHEANRGPWKILEDVGVIIKEVNLLDDGTLDYEDFEIKSQIKQYFLLWECHQMQLEH